MIKVESYLYEGGHGKAEHLHPTKDQILGYQQNTMRLEEATYILRKTNLRNNFQKDEELKAGKLTL